MRVVSVDEAMKIGHRHQLAGEPLRAEAIYRQVLQLYPDHADALHLLGLLLGQDGQVEPAVQLIARAIELRPDQSAYYNNLGEFYRRLDRLDDSLKSLETAIRLKPDYPEAWNNLGLTLRQKAQPEEAVAAFIKALDLRQPYPIAMNSLGVALKDLGKLDEAMEAHRLALQMKPDFVAACSNVLGLLYFHPGYDERAIHPDHARWDELFGIPLRATWKPHANDRNADRRLKIGYVSADFYNQAEAFFVLPLLEGHDHSQVEIHCYSNVGKPDGITDRHKKSADVWHDIVGMKDQALADKIQGDGIDILVDLTMHMGDNRLLVFARKPAPVQVTWLAYPGTTGLSAIDYRFTDRYMDPENAATDFYSETSVRLPDCWVAYDSLTDMPLGPPRPQEDTGPILFGSLNVSLKINEPTLALWARVLKAVEDSRLLILLNPGSFRERTREYLNAQGIGDDRLEFVARMHRREYLRMYDRIDIGLDPLPYNGITTTCDALFMGTPVVTLTGKTAAGRAGQGILATMGLPELVAHTPDQFVEIAANLANDRARLRVYRTTLRERMQKSPLADGRRFARNVEQAYRTMWRKWCESFV